MILGAVIGLAAAYLVGTVVSILRMRARNEREEKARCPQPVPDLNTVKLGMRVQLRPQIAAERNRGLFEPLPGLSYREGARPISRRWEGVIQDFRLPLMVDEEVAASKGLLPAQSPFDRDGFSREVVYVDVGDLSHAEAHAQIQAAKMVTHPVAGRFGEQPRMVVSHEWQSTIEPPLDEDGWSRVEKYPRGFGQTMYTILWDHGATTEEAAADLLRVMP